MFKIRKKDIEEIILVGGSSRMPKVEEIMNEYFGEKIRICKSINPDEVVAYGATLQAAYSMKVDSMDDILINDVIPYNIGLASVKGNSFDAFDKLIEKGTNIPYEIEKKYSAYRDNQSSALIEVYEGNNTLCMNNRLLGKTILRNIKNKGWCA